MYNPQWSQMTFNHFLKIQLHLVGSVDLVQTNLVQTSTIWPIAFVQFEAAIIGLQDLFDDGTDLTRSEVNSGFRNSPRRRTWMKSWTMASRLTTFLLKPIIDERINLSTFVFPFLYFFLRSFLLCLHNMGQPPRPQFRLSGKCFDKITYH